MKLPHVTTMLRHQPTQARGQRKVEHILACAEGLFAEVGFEAATTNAIAARAGVSIGSLYQFFASKDGILEAIVERYLEKTRATTTRVLGDGRNLGLEETFDLLIEALVEMQDQRPYYLQCLNQRRLTPAASLAVGRLLDELATYVAKFLVAHGAAADDVMLDLRSHVCVETIGALLPLALAVRGRARVQVMVEIRTVLMRYLSPTLTDQGAN